MTAVGYTSGDPGKLDRGGYAKGDVVAADAAGSLGAVHVGADTQVVTADSAQPRGLAYAAGGGGGGGTPSNTVVTETSYGQASTAGVAVAYSRGDHTHGSPSLTSASPTTSAVGDAAAVGAAATPARADHTHGRESFGAVTGQTSYGAATGNGAATTLARSDHTHGTPDKFVPYHAAALGLVYASYDLLVAGQDSLNLGSGVMIIQLARPGKVPLTNLGAWLTGLGVTSSGVARFGLYTVAGVKIDQTADVNTLFSGAVGHIEAALGATQQLVADTNYYVAVLTHFSGTAPKIAGQLTAGGGGLNVPTVKGNRPALFLTGQTDLPVSFDPSTASVNSGSYWLTGS